MTLLDRIRDLMIADDDDHEEQSEYLIEAFTDATPKAKLAIDRCFVALCGYRLSGLIEEDAYELRRRTRR